ncbi:ABC transporter permease subunit [Candidatus Acetothermia bacterium]|nr:ABC transporter permease subunit [Candidatus Acetothermia bacterium]
MKRIRNTAPLLVVLAGLFVLGYPMAFLLGYPQAKNNFEDRNRWIQRVIKAAPPLNLDSTTLRFDAAADLSNGLLVRDGTPLADRYQIEPGKIKLSQPIPLIVPVGVEGLVDGQNRLFHVATAERERPLYLNGKLMTMAYEVAPEKPDGQRETFTFTDTKGVFVFRGKWLQLGKDYALDGDTLRLYEPAPLWLELRAEPEWARPLRVTGDYAWADDKTIVLQEPPPPGSEIVLGESTVTWAEKLRGPIDGANRTFAFSHGDLVPDDATRRLFVGNRQLSPQEYLITDAKQGTVVLKETPPPGSIVWTDWYTIYDHPTCGTTVLQCFFSLPQHPMPLPHEIIARIPSFVMRYDFQSERNVVREAIYTAQGTLVALLLGSIVGMTFAVLFVLAVPLERALLPWVIASQTVPIIALVPMLVLILAQFGVQIQSSRLPSALIGGYLSFFPITVGMTKGLRSVDPLKLDLMRSYGATRPQEFMKLRFYAAMSYLFPSLKVGVAVSLLGALISETETSNAKGLGFAILGQVQAGNVADLWVLFLVTAAMGILFVSVVGWLEKLIAPWVRKL